MLSLVRLLSRLQLQSALPAAQGDEVRLTAFLA
jgi:hypothetical protein